MTRYQPSDEEIFAKVDATFSTLNGQRSSGLARLNMLQNSKHQALEKEKARLAKKYGSDHPRVQKIAARLTYDAGRQKELAREIEKTKITVPTIDVNTWMAHGRVVNAAGVGQPGLTVSLFDESGKWLRQLGYVCTNEQGYFALRYTVAAGEQPAIPATTKLFLTVTDGEFNILHREQEPLFLALGQIDYRLIVLGEKGGSCTPPEPGTDESSTPGPDVWMVRGRVVDAAKQPVRGVVVSLYDKDLFFSDVLGSTLTDNGGNFHVLYRPESFRDLFDKKPDLYVRVFDQHGRVLYSSQNAIRPNAGRVEEFQITLTGKMDTGER